MEHTRTSLLKAIHDVNGNNFHNVAREVYAYQLEHNSTFQEYVCSIRGDLQRAKESEFVYLPITLFKSHKIITGEWEEQAIFLSSKTTGDTASNHHVRDLEWYRLSCERCWQAFYEKVEDYKFLCLLPGYLEREGSSLIDMMNHFVGISKHKGGFYLRNHRELYDNLIESKRNRIPTVLFGVTYALLDFIEEYTLDFPDLIVFETGGMKGRRAELLKSDLHRLLSKGFGVNKIHSEYGMTELFSQAYSVGDGIFYCPPQMSVHVSEITDPFQQEKESKTGVLNVIDLANLDTCSFIQTQDLARQYEDGSFELMGRLDYGDIRGCNLMLENM